jgi:hypothetical protein
MTYYGTVMSVCLSVRPSVQDSRARIDMKAFWYIVDHGGCKGPQWGKPYLHVFILKKNLLLQNQQANFN